MPGKSRIAQATALKREPPQREPGKAHKIKLDHDLMADALDYAWLGATNEQIANLCGVSLTTVSEWIATSKDFGRRLLKARELALAEVVKSQHHAAKGYSHPETKLIVVGGKVEKHVITKHYPPSTAAAQLLLYNRDKARWRDSKQVEHTGQIDLMAMIDRALGPGDDAKVIEGTTSGVVGDDDDAQPTGK